MHGLSQGGKETGKKGQIKGQERDEIEGRSKALRVKCARVVCFVI